MTSRALARVNLAAIERNAATLVRASPRLCAVVKADGYGHGALQCARAALAGGATMLAVATAAEAAQLRAGAVAAPIIVLGALSRDELTQAIAADAEVVAWTDTMLDWIEQQTGGRVHVKLDTGMGRLGTRDGALADRLVARALASEAIELAGLMTHFATADESDTSFLEQQSERFTAWIEPLRERHGPILAHAENSAALLTAGSTRFDMARCGVALYGLDPFGVDAAPHGLEPALELHSWVAALKPCAPGESAGYGRRFIASEPTVVAVLPIGYADGVRRVLSPGADALIGGIRRPFAGTISMDNLAVEVGGGGGVEIGSAAILIGAGGGERITAEELAGLAGTINYEITCGVSERVRREYHRDGEPVEA
ncbi:MAG: alanine racemase [Solirubrobacteraceae bacterium]|jgi:alanine racemase